MAWWKSVPNLCSGAASTRYSITSTRNTLCGSNFILVCLKQCPQFYVDVESLRWATVWYKTVRFCLMMAMEIHETEYPCWLQLFNGIVCMAGWARVFPVHPPFAPPSSMGGPMVVRDPADTLQWASVFHTHVCMCKACESSIRHSLKKNRNGEPFRFWWDEGNESVAWGSWC